MQKLKTSSLIKNKDKYHSVTISPILGGKYSVEYFHKERTKTGRPKQSSKIVDSIIEDYEIPYISNSTVAHLGIKTYQHYQEEGFYINLYKN